MTDWEVLIHAAIGVLFVLFFGALLAYTLAYAILRALLWTIFGS